MIFSSDLAMLSWNSISSILTYTLTLDVLEPIYICLLHLASNRQTYVEVKHGLLSHFSVVEKPREGCLSDRKEFVNLCERLHKGSGRLKKHISQTNSSHNSGKQSLKVRKIDNKENC